MVGAQKVPVTFSASWAIRMIRKDSKEGIGYSVVELDGVRHIFAAAAPAGGGDLAEQARDALGTIEQLIREEGTRGSIVHQAVFLRDIGQRDACRAIMREFYGGQQPATTYIPQAPCCGKLLEIEALGVGRRADDVRIERFSEQLVVVRHGGVAWVHLADVRAGTAAPGVYDRSLEALRQAQGQLEAHGFAFQQLVRTWLYLGDIVGLEGDTQRYQELNRARSDFYRGPRFGNCHVPSGFNRPVYPASTGIGSGGRDVIMSGIAMASDRKDVVLMPLENPLQTSAFDYAAQYGPTSPKFARAMVVAAGEFACIFISGTASITGSETRHAGDVEGQTWQTLDNIAALISEENLCRHRLPGFGATLDDLALVRVYVKRPQDFPTARQVCNVRLGELPAVYAIADVCRDDLLVEIEGVAFSRRRR
jgi:enamine deaminase RidA (YjgF/YER057c/UK114 family)